MSRRAPFVPDGVPVLSRGRHRSPRKGACFMEMASFLAGERWSDHPECTHPVLATLARCVNDMLDETHRQRLVTMIPEVVGLNPHDPRVATALVLTTARAALPISAEERQNVMALAILNAEGILAEQDGRSPGQLSQASRTALATSPAAERWARIHLARIGIQRCSSAPLERGQGRRPGRRRHRAGLRRRPRGAPVSFCATASTSSRPSRRSPRLCAPAVVPWVAPTTRPARTSPSAPADQQARTLAR